MEINFLLASALITLILAVLLLFLPKLLNFLNEIGNRNIVIIDAREEKLLLTGGIMLTLAGGLILAIKQSVFPWLNLAAWFGIIFGLITIFVPEAMIKINFWSSKHIFAPRNENLFRRYILGIILLLIAIYIFYILLTSSGAIEVTQVRYK